MPKGGLMPGGEKGRPRIAPEQRKIRRSVVYLTPAQDAWTREECARRGVAWSVLVGELIDAEMRYREWIDAKVKARKEGKPSAKSCILFVNNQCTPISAENLW